MFFVSLSQPSGFAALVLAICQFFLCVEAAQLPSRPWRRATDETGVKRRQEGSPTAPNFIRRAHHDSIVLGDYIYIDGGEVSQYINGKADSLSVRQNNNTLSIYLGSSWDASSVEIQTIDKQDAPVYKDPSLWSNGKDGIYMFSGEPSYYLDETSADIALWKFTATSSGSGTWDKQNPSDARGFNQLTRPAMALAASYHNTGYVLGGCASGVPVPGMVSYNWTSGQWSNASTSAYTALGTAVAGKLHHVPMYGKDGLLFLLGGSSTATMTGCRENGRDRSQIPFNNITIYDPEDGKWYSQTTTGDSPPMRETFCLVGAQGNNDTYEIFVMSGYDSFHEKTLDDMYILSLPGFHWFRVSDTSGSNRYAHTCNLVGNRQMLSIGGIDWDKGFPEAWQDVDPWEQGLGVFDLTELKWKTNYDAGADAYKSPQVVQDWYNQGNAKDVAWRDDQVRALFSAETAAQAGPSNSSSSRDDEDGSTSNNTGAIVGGTVGGVAALLLLACLAWFLLRRRKRANSANIHGATSQPITYTHQQEYPNNFSDVGYRPVAEADWERAVSEMPANKVVRELPNATSVQELPN
ncbi:uncharacterized protein K452DRAFT_268529 [Aplosporella prunicola CBS 121167]|uniref:Kelch repeat protein n=1 Tax=Aplosporella prunicola CBS 121167 TaxID=1176127 RepID=A0A6A6BIT9_9PEZI|nr:uncharacterized protein K452DRAFT_268529 [Aplosporella prunicola CBS 121167]KAF2143194.1 hypothetical protein K452DRAFT_268529 [Aplosporella prunicola CBS 121167]